MNQKIELRGIWLAICGLVLGGMLVFYAQPAGVTAHGTDITYTIQSTVLVEANFETGEPMSEAQISVFAPDDPSTPWLQGIADADGKFTFVPDPEFSGTYDVRIRSAGHGEILAIPINGVGQATAGNSTMQQIIMAAAVIWGFIGTALYFSARTQTKSGPSSHSSDKSPSKSTEGNLENAHT